MSRLIELTILAAVVATALFCGAMLTKPGPYDDGQIDYPPGADARG